MAKVSITIATFREPKVSTSWFGLVAGQSPEIPPLDPATNLPFRRRRDTAASATTPTAFPEIAPTLPIAPPMPSNVLTEPRMQPSAFTPDVTTTTSIEADEIFHLFLISSDEHLPAEINHPAQVRTALLVGSYRNARVVETIFFRENRDKETATATGREIRWSSIMDQSQKIRDYIDGQPNAPDLPKHDELQEFGVDLFQAMFFGNVRRLYDVARAEAGRSGRRLDIVMTSMINWVADKPWEFAYDPNRQTFLATEDVNFTRNVLTAVPCDQIPRRKPPMRILIVAAQPVGLALVSAEGEERMIRRGFRHLVESRLAEVEVLLSATPELLHQRLQHFTDDYDRVDRFDIIHFIGHGEYRDDEKEAYFIFEDSKGRAHPVSAENMRQILCHRGIRLVFFNACETGMVDRSGYRFDFNRGLAPKIVAGGIPAVVANQYKVLDSSATEFAQRFYWSLAQGSTVGDAAREARVAVNYSIAGESIDWAVPVVYARNPAHRLFTPSQKSEASVHQPGRSARRGISEFTVRIGLWDVNCALPNLEQFVDLFNDVQKYYQFQIVDISAPLGTWRLMPSSHRDGRGRLGGTIRADEVAQKLRIQVSGLGIDHLFCVTTFEISGYVRKKYYPNLTMWNDDEPDYRVVIFSAQLLTR